MTWGWYNIVCFVKLLQYYFYKNICAKHSLLITPSFCKTLNIILMLYSSIFHSHSDLYYTEGGQKSQKHLTLYEQGVETPFAFGTASALFGMLLHKSWTVSRSMFDNRSRKASSTSSNSDRIPWQLGHVSIWWLGKQWRRHDFILFVKPLISLVVCMRTSEYGGITRGTVLAPKGAPLSHKTALCSSAVKQPHRVTMRLITPKSRSSAEGALLVSQLHAGCPRLANAVKVWDKFPWQIWSLCHTFRSWQIYSPAFLLLSEPQYMTKK